MPRIKIYPTNNHTIIIHEITHNNDVNSPTT